MKPKASEADKWNRIGRRRCVVVVFQLFEVVVWSTSLAEGLQKLSLSLSSSSFPSCNAISAPGEREPKEGVGVFSGFVAL